MNTAAYDAIISNGLKEFGDPAIRNKRIFGNGANDRTSTVRLLVVDGCFHLMGVGNRSEWVDTKTLRSTIAEFLEEAANYVPVTPSGVEREFLEEAGLNF